MTCIDGTLTLDFDTADREREFDDPNGRPGEAMGRAAA